MNEGNMLSKHHVYPARYRNGNTEKKIVTVAEHRAWHLLTDDEHGQAVHPLNAMKILAKKFLPSDMEDCYNKEVV